jgi:small-conductance mechanosensitive channel
MGIDIPSLDRIPPYLLKTLELAVILLFTWVLARVARTIVGRAFRISLPAMSRYAQRIVSWSIWFLGILFGIAQIGMSITIALFATGLVGLALIVSLKDTFQNLFSRPFLDLYSQYKTGDDISIHGHSGKVVEINSLNTILLNEEGEMIIIPNALFMREVLINRSAHARQEVTIPFVISKEFDLVEFEKRLLAICERRKEDLKRGTQPTVATRPLDKKTNEVLLLLTLRHPEKKGELLAELNEEVKALLDEMEAEMEEREGAE